MNIITHSVSTMFTKAPTLLIVATVFLLATGFVVDDPDPAETRVSNCTPVVLTAETAETLMDVKQDIGTVFGGTVCFSSCSDFPCCFILDDPSDGSDGPSEQPMEI